MATQRDLKLDAITQGSDAEPTGIEHDELLIAFAEAVVSRKEQLIAPLRERVRQEMGDRELVDISGVVANFHRMTRIADATGIPLDERSVGISEDLRESLGINSFGSAKNTLGD